MDTYQQDDEQDVERIMALAEQFLGDRQRASKWLRRPNPALGGGTPFDALASESGRRAVENLLGRIGYGGVS